MVHPAEQPRAGDGRRATRPLDSARRTAGNGLALRNLVGVLAAVLGLLFTAQGATSAKPTTARNPVMLVHGWTAGGRLTQWAEVFAPLAAALKGDGHAIYYVTLPGDINTQNARVIARAVIAASAEHGGAKVDLIGHSMGGLSARYYLKYLGGDAHVSHYVSMGTGQYGWIPTCVLPSDLGGEMCPNSHFLRVLNRGDDTPGTVAYTTLRTIADDQLLITKPDRHLDGGVCVRDGVNGGEHPDEPGNATVIALVRRALDGVCPGTFVTAPIRN